MICISAIDKLLEFLKIVADDLKSRHEEIPRSLLKLHIYCDKYFKKNKFEVKKFQDLFKACKGDLSRLTLQRILYFPYPPLNINDENEFFIKMDDLEKQVIALRIAPQENNVVGGSLTWEESALIGSVNKWWMEGGEDGKALIKLLGDILLPAKSYSIFNLTANLKNPILRAHTFRPINYIGPWLFYQPQGQQLVLAVPADWRSFSDTSMITILHRMFQGFEGYPENLRFKRIYKACRLQQISSDQYEIISPGYLLLHGFQYPSLALPQAYETLLSQRKKVT